MISSTQVMWTCIPNGIVTTSTGTPASPLTFKISVVVTPRITTSGGDTIGGTVFEQWPAFVRAVTAGNGWTVAFAGVQATATVTTDYLSASPAFNVDGATLWQEIFPPSTPLSTTLTTAVPDDLTIHSYDSGKVATAIREAHRYAVRSHARHGRLVLTGSDPYSYLLNERKKAQRVLPKMAAALRGHSRGAAHHVLKSAYQAETGDLDVGYELMRHSLYYDHGGHRAHLRAQRGVQHAAPKDATTAPANNDFNGIIGHLGGQSQLLRKLGLVIDLQVVPPANVMTYVGQLKGAQLPPRGNNWVMAMNMPAASTFGASYASVNFVNPVTLADVSGSVFRTSVLAAPDPSAGSAGTIHNGYIPVGDTAQYSVYTEDTEGTPIKLDMTTDTPTASGAQLADGTDKVTPFPALRTAGVAIAQTGRDQALESQLVKQTQLTNQYWGNAPANQRLYAEDMVRGYAVDVKVTNAAGVDSPYKSICLRDTRMYFPGLPAGTQSSFVISDEGYTKASAANAPDDKNELDVHSAIVGWEGWSLGAQRPGRAITSGTPAGDTVQTETPLQPVNASTPDFPTCQLTVRARAGSLPRLRFGSTYSFRVRAIDIAGNDMTIPNVGVPPIPTATVADPTVSGSVKYLRYEPVPNPVLVLQAPVTEGEHLENLVIRSNPWGATPQNAAQYAATAAQNSPMNPYLATSARWIAAPKGSWSQAEAMGTLDASYFNPIATSVASDVQSGALAAGKAYSTATFLAAKTALFLCSQKEAGLLTHTKVWDTSNLSATSPSATNPVQIITPPTAQNLPPPTDPGQPLGTGQYNILLNNGSPVTIPYLPDANAKGFALQQLDDGGNVIAGTTVYRSYAPRPGTSWPEIDMPQIVLQDGGVGAPAPVLSSNTANPSGLDSSSPASNTPVVFSLAPGQQVSLSYGSVVADITKMAGSDIDVTGVGVDTIPTYAPFRPLTLVHAVQQPKPPSQLVVNFQPRQPGDTSVTITGGFTTDGLTTNNVDMNCLWVERVDAEMSANILEAPDGTHRRVTLQSGRVQSWTLDTTDTAIAFPAAIPTAGSPPPIVQHFGDTKTRLLTYQVTATTRFKEYFPASLQSDSSHFTNSCPAGTLAESQVASTGIRIPSTARPITPKILYVLPTYAWAPQTSKTIAGGSSTTSTRAGRGLRVFVDRPWFSTGDGEQLAVLVAPQGATAATVLGLAPFVSQIGIDPIRFAQSDTIAPVDQNWVQGGVPVTGVPLAENGQTVTILAFNPSAFDPVRKLWYFDIEFAASFNGITATEAPFVRLALARYQPNSIGCPAFPNATSGDLRMSGVVLADMVKLTADRTGTYLVNASTGAVNVTVQGRVYSDEAWTPTSGTLTANTRNDAAADGRMVFAQVLESTAPIPGEFDWYPVGGAVNLLPYQTTGSAGSSTLLSFMGSVPKPAGLVAGAKHQLLITEHEVFATDNEVAFPGSATVKNYPSGPMQFHAPPPPPARPPIAVNTTSRIIFSDVLPLPY